MYFIVPCPVPRPKLIYHVEINTNTDWDGQLPLLVEVAIFDNISKYYKCVEV